MNRIRSKKLWQFLFNSGALDRGEEAIALAKAEYRKQYKREWKRQNKDKPKRELRPEFTLGQHHRLKVKARLNGYTPTKYLKEIALATLDGKITPLPFRHRLEDALQKITVAGHELHSLRSSAYVVTSDRLNQVETLIKEAEEKLIQYLYLP